MKLNHLFPGPPPADRARRSEVIRRAHLEHGYSLSEIGHAITLRYSTISRIVNTTKDASEDKIMTLFHAFSSDTRTTKTTTPS